MLYLSIYGLKDIRTFFNCGTRVDCYNYEEVANIISKENDNNLKIICDFQYSRLKKEITSFINDDEFKYKIVFLTTKKGVHNW